MDAIKEIYVVNAGIGILGDALDQDPDAIDRLLRINVHAPYHAAVEAARQMPEGGRIIVIGSVNGDRMPVAGMASYALSKSALQGLARSPVISSASTVQEPSALTVPAESRAPAGRLSMMSEMVSEPSVSVREGSMLRGMKADLPVPDRVAVISGKKRRIIASEIAGGQ